MRRAPPQLNLYRGRTSTRTRTSNRMDEPAWLPKFHAVPQDSDRREPMLGTPPLPVEHGTQRTQVDGHCVDGCLRANVPAGPQSRAAVRHQVRAAPRLRSRKSRSRHTSRRYRQSRRRTYDTTIPPWCSRKRFRNPSSNGFGSQSNSGRVDKALRTLSIRHRNLSLLCRAMSVAAWISLIPRSKDGSSPFVAFTSIRHPIPAWLNRKSKPRPRTDSVASSVDKAFTLDKSGSSLDLQTRLSDRRG